MIEHNVYIVVADGRRAFVYRNSGTAQAPHLEHVTGFEQKNPPSREHGTDRPGTGFSSAGGVRSSISETDYHDAQEKVFAREIIQMVSDLKREHTITKLIWVAPPRMLAELRRDMPHQLKEITVKEVDKDLTKHAPHDIARLIGA